MIQDTEARLDSAVAAARAAGAFIKESFGKGFIPEFKGHRDPVTEVDREAELLIRSRLQQDHPEIEFWGEEFGRTSDAGGLTWLVDPLDGTKNFVHGYPFVAVSIALVRDDKPEIAVVFDPLRDQLYHAVRGYGAFLDGERLEASRTATVEEALVVTGFTFRPLRQRELLVRACEQCQGLRRGGAAVLDLCQVALGSIDAMWQFNLMPWDLAAASLLIEEAQGTVTRVDGSPFDIHGNQILATNTTLHKKFVDLLA